MNNQHADATSGNRPCYVHNLWRDFLFDPGPMNVTISRQKNDFVT